MKEIKIPRTEELFELTHTIAAPLLSRYVYPDEALSGLYDFIAEAARGLGDDFYERSEGVYVAMDAEVDETARILPPTIIGKGAQIRHGAFLRGGVIVGDGAVVGNSSEVKSSILFDGAKLPHYNYVGDSIVGHLAHLGAGATVSNLKLDKSPVRMRADGEIRDTGRRKLGAMIGDGAEIGCGAVLCPGTTVGKGARIYPLTLVRGTVASGVIYDGKEERKILE